MNEKDINSIVMPVPSIYGWMQDISSKQRRSSRSVSLVSNWVGLTSLCTNSRVHTRWGSSRARQPTTR